MTTNDETTWDRDARACLAGLAAREDTTRAADARDAALIADALASERAKRGAVEAGGPTRTTRGRGRSG